MNDEPSSSALPSLPSDDAQNESSLTAPPDTAELADRRKRNRRMFNKKRSELLDDLLKTLDILVYAELSTVYYMDCSFLRFLLRAFVQFLFLTPKPAIFPEPPPNRPYVGGILGTNALCMILHAVCGAPSAGEATRGYLHGGLAIDFIGQKGPSSKLHLLLLDLLLVILQIFHLSAHVTRQRLKQNTDPASAERPDAATSSAQDLDHEERGVRRSDEQQDMEMQALNPSGSAVVDASEDGDTISERRALLNPNAIRTDGHIFDAFISGQIVLADIDLRRTVQEQFWAYQNAPRDPDPVASGRELGANLTAQMFRWRIRGAIG